MKIVIVTGSRHHQNDHLICRVLDRHLYEQDVLYVGDAKGTDDIASVYASDLNIDMVKFIANWDFFGKSAGPKRNRRMIGSALDSDLPILLLAFPLNQSKGTHDCIRAAIEMGVEDIRVYHDD